MLTVALGAAPSAHAATFAVETSVTEGSPATVTLSCSLTDTINGTQHTIAVAPGTAARPADFQNPANATLRCGATGSDTTEVVPTVPDALDENPESFSVSVTNAGDPRTVTIDDDDPPPAVSIGAATVGEGAPGAGGRLAVPVTLDRPSGLEVRVTVTPARGPAEGPPAVPEEDFAPAPMQVAIPAGQTSGVAVVPIVGDRLDEGTEKVGLTAGAPVNATIGTGGAIGTIDDDDVPQVAIDIVDRPEGTGGITPFEFSVTLTNPSTRPIEVDVATKDASATAGADFQAITTTVTFAPGETRRPVAVAVVADSVQEQAEVFGLEANAARGASLPKDPGVGIIRNDDRVQIDAGQSGLASGGTADGSATALSLGSLRGSRGRVSAMLSCPAAARACAVELTFFTDPARRSKVRKLRRERRLGTVRVTVLGGQSQRVSLRLRRDDRSLVSRAGRVRVTGYATSTAADGTVAVARARGTVRP